MSSIVFCLLSSWCGPCKLLVPKLEQLVAKRKGQVMLAKIDIDNLTELADSYQVNLLHFRSYHNHHNHFYYNLIGDSCANSDSTQKWQRS